MSTLIFTANVSDSNFQTWKRIDNIIRTHQPDRFKVLGYEGLFAWAPEYYDFSRMFRNDKTYIQYEFTEEEWIIFKLKWL